MDLGALLHRDLETRAVRVQHGQEDRPGVHDFRSSGAPRADRRSEQTPQASHLGAAVHQGAPRHFLHAPIAVSPTFSDTQDLGVTLRSQSLVKARPDITCAEVVARLRFDLDVVVSEPTVCRAFQFLKQTRKRKVRTAVVKHSPQNQLRTIEFMRWQMTRPASQLIFIDEMGIRAADAERNYARSREGTAAAQPGAAHCNGERGVLQNFLCALGVEGILACSYDVQGSVDSRVFELWVTVMLIPAIQQRYPFGGVCVVMDNARFHRARVLQDIFARAGIDLIFLPAYSPEYNPIETAFAWVKAHVRRTPTRSIRDIPAATYAALAEVSGDLAKAWMRHSNYVFDP